MPTVPLLVLVLVLGGLLVATVRAPSIRLDVAGDTLHVRLSPLDKLACFHRDLALPLSQVEGVVATSRALVPTTGMRLPGTSLPGLVRAGSYGIGARRDFWDVRRGDTVLVLQLRPGAAYRRVVLQVPDATATALEVRPAVGAYTGTLT